MVTGGYRPVGNQRLGLASIILTANPNSEAGTDFVGQVTNKPTA